MSPWDQAVLLSSSTALQGSLHPFLLPFILPSISPCLPSVLHPSYFLSYHPFLPLSITSSIPPFIIHPSLIPSVLFSILPSITPSTHPSICLFLPLSMTSSFPPSLHPPSFPHLSSQSCCTLTLLCSLHFLTSPAFPNCSVRCYLFRIFKSPQDTGGGLGSL